jgi:hypothetical protein
MEDTMMLYVIRGDSVTAHASPPAIISEGELVVQSIEDILPVRHSPPGPSRQTGARAFAQI